MNGGARLDDARVARLREAFASAAEVAGRGERCPPHEDLWGSVRGELGRRETERLVMHLGECAACATAWRLARDLRSDEPRGAVVAGSAIRFRLHWVRVAAAAAVVVAIVAVGVRLWAPGRGPAVEFRSGEGDWIEPLLREGEALPRGHCLLRWTPGPEGTAYRVRVTTEDLEPIASGRGIRVAEFLVPAQELDPVPTGARIVWQVTAHLPDGTKANSRSFTSEIR